jgi:hypothetical protein
METRVNMHRIRPVLPALLLLLLPACGGNKSTQTFAPKVDKHEAKPDKKSGKTADTREESAQPEDPPVKDPTPVTGGTVLAHKRNVGKVLVYEGSFDRQQTGTNKATESGSFYITYYTAERDRAGANLDLVAIRRTFLDRKRTETMEQGKTVDKVLPNSEELIELGPNFKDAQGLRCYGFDAQSNIAQFFEDILTLQDGTLVRGRVTRKDENTVTVETNEGQKEFARLRVTKMERVNTPHVLMYDTPHYFFPIFSSKPVEPGSTWSFTIMMVIPMNQGGGGVMPTQFPVHMTAKLRALQGGVATIDYAVRGEFDTEKEPFKQRFGAAFLQRNRMLHSIESQGTITLDVQKGVMIEKVEEAKIHIEATSVIPVAANQPPQQNHTESTIVSRFRLKWLPPGTKLKSGVEVPPSE